VARPMRDLPLRPEDELSLTDLVNRVLDKGAVVSGDVVISVAGVDLVYVGLRLLLSSVESMRDKLEPGGGF
jgi:gas vesicle structural protein